MFDSYLLESWDKISLITCQSAHIEALLFNINSKTRVKFPVQTEFHPYRATKKETEKKNIKQMFEAFRSVARSFNKKAVP